MGDRLTRDDIGQVYHRCVQSYREMGSNPQEAQEKAREVMEQALNLTNIKEMLPEGWEGLDPR